MMQNKCILMVSFAVSLTFKRYKNKKHFTSKYSYEQYLYRR